jgi:serine/threonine protein kinase
MPPPSAPRPPSVGEAVNSYQIVAELGAGGMGVVYKALDTRLQRTVALKFLPSALNSDERARTLFMGEARAASALDHPNIGTESLHVREDRRNVAGLAGRFGHEPLAIGDLILTEVLEGFAAERDFSAARKMPTC